MPEQMPMKHVLLARGAQMRSPACWLPYSEPEAFGISSELMMSSCLQVDTLHSGEYIGDEVDEAEERRARRAVALSFLSNMYALTTTEHSLGCMHP